MAKLITLEINRRHDSRGFWLRCALFTFALHWWPRWRAMPGLCITLWAGRGAGYVSTKWRIALPTLFLAVNAKGGRRWLYAPARFRAGLTWNANEVPYHFGS
ncbi:MAG TPA: hypothetical protein VHM19_23210 [Polyangiales bacterium]|jgi:hypothetical protein|nr:hypothetical protein [Polyangiales bacterium]